MKAFPGYDVFLCTECGLSYGVPDIPVGNSSFDSYPWTKEWTKNFENHVEKAVRALSFKLAVVNGISSPVSSMLDVGCGNGAFLAAAERQGIYTEGIDIDRDHIRFAVSQGLRAHYCDISDYNAPRQFDFIHIKESFHLVTKTKQFIESVVALMGPRTVLYLDSTHEAGLAARFRKRWVTPPRYGQLYPPLHNRTFNKRSLTNLLDAAGLNIVKFVCFNRGNIIYCPTSKKRFRQYIVNPLLDGFFLGGFIGCYAIKKSKE